MKNVNIKDQKRARRHKKIRAKISGTSTKPRLSVFKSNTALYAQLIDDSSGTTIAAAKGAKAEEVGTEVAKHALAVGITSVVFDRGGYMYTGKIKKLAEAARTGGLEF